LTKSLKIGNGALLKEIADGSREAIEFHIKLIEPSVNGLFNIR